MMTYNEGLAAARAILSKDPDSAHPKNLSDDLLALVLQCSNNESANEIALPIMLVLHFYCEDSNVMHSEDLTEYLHKKFRCYREDCEKEFKKRHLNVVLFHHYDRQSINE